MIIRSGDFEVSVHSLLFQPEYYLFDVAMHTGLSKFLIISENFLDLAPFVDIKMEPVAQAKFSVKTRELFALEGQHDTARPKIHFIFHHAFVCSTLLARCLNQIGAFFSLKEPWILRRLSDIKRTQRDSIPDAQWREMFVKYTSLLAKNYETGREVVVKATNVANNLIEDVITISPERKILYLYSDPESFLISNLKKTPETQKKMPSLYQSFTQDSDFVQRFKEYADSSKFTLLQVCALIWVANIYNLQSVVKTKKYDGLRTLEMQTFLSDAEHAVAGVSKHFGHAPNADERALMVHPDVMQNNAKDQRCKYSNLLREQESKRIREIHGQEIADVVSWIDPVIRELQLIEFLESRAG